MKANKEKKMQMNLEIKNYLIKMIKMNLNCFKISYISGQGGFSETLLDNARQRVKERLVNLFENIEFVYIISEPGKNFKISFIACFRPIIAPSLDESSLYSIFHELYMLYDKFNINILKTNNDIDTALQTMKIHSRFSNHTIVSFSRIFENHHASLEDFLVGNFEKRKDYGLVEINKYSVIKGNFYNIFDEYSLYNLIMIYLKNSGKGIVDSEEIIEIANQLKKEDNVLIQFLNEMYYFQTSTTDLHQLFIRHIASLMKNVLPQIQNGVKNQ